MSDVRRATPSRASYDGESMSTPAHAAPTPHRWGLHRIAGKPAKVALAVVAGAVIASAVVTVVGRSAPPARSTTGTGGSLPAAAAAPTTTVPQVPLVPLTVRSITPASAATGVGPGGVVTITFSVPPASGSARPTLSPAVAGHWVLDGARWSFHPSAGFLPQTKETVRVAASTTVANEGHRQTHLSATFTSSFTVGVGSTLRLQELLSELHYLPVTFTRTAVPATTAGTETAAATTGSALQDEPTVADAVSTSPQAGRFSWTHADVPTSLTAQWVAGKPHVVTRGAVMAFEADHGLAPDGVAGPEVWGALRTAVAARQVDPRAYSYIEVTENQPETLTVWQDGHDVYSSLANTGVPGADTAQGIFPVYLRFTTTTMVGTDTNGQTYNDRGVPWVAYFNGGDAVHGYPRPGYGYPQSNGCVELPIPNAEAVFTSGQDWYGTLVDVR
jgi:peptidoglycan hydrolase-like protein with peptidoglycan-binding domain